MSGTLVLIVVLVLVIGLVVWVIASYNGLVRLKNAVDGAWAQIDVQLRRRNDLLPNLVETVKGYASHEKETLERVIAARNASLSAKGPRDEAAADNLVTGALRQLFALQEAYPDLKANQNFLALQEELTSTESRVAYARQYYNDNVQRYNTRIQSFPAMIFASMFRFTEREYFEADEGSREAPQVRF